MRPKQAPDNLAIEPDLVLVWGWGCMATDSIGLYDNGRCKGNEGVASGTLPKSGFLVGPIIDSLHRILCLSLAWLYYHMVAALRYCSQNVVNLQLK